MKKVYFVVAYVVGMFLGVLLFNILAHHKKPTYKPKVITKTIIKTKVKTITKNVCSTKIDVNKLAGWIYKNSFRLSKKQANYLAHILIKYSHPLLLTAIIYRESSFNPTAVSAPVRYRGKKIFAIGLTQVLLTDEHIKQLKQAGIIQTPRDLFDMTTNVKAGNYILNDIIQLSNGNITKALLTYCGGNKRYVNEVLQILGQLTITVKGD